MTYSSQLQAALDLVATAGIRESDYAPPMHRLLWRLGVNVPPPHFAAFLYNAVITGGWFALAWGLVMWLAIWSKQGMSVHSAVGVAAGVGCFLVSRWRSTIDSVRASIGCHDGPKSRCT